MSKKRTSGIDDLVTTLIRQHGLTEALDRARNQALAPANPHPSKSIWRYVWVRLRDIRDLRR